MKSVCLSVFGLFDEQKILEVLLKKYLAATENANTWMIPTVLISSSDEGSIGRSALVRIVPGFGPFLCLCGHGVLTMTCHSSLRGRCRQKNMKQDPRQFPTAVSFVCVRKNGWLLYM